MNIGDLNTVVNIAKNVSYGFDLPAFKVLEKFQVKYFKIIFFLSLLLKLEI